MCSSRAPELFKVTGGGKPRGADSGQAAEAQSYSHADGSGLTAGLVGLRWLLDYIRSGKDYYC